MGQDEWLRIFPAGTYVHEVDVEAVDLDEKIRVGIQARCQALHVVL